MEGFSHNERPKNVEGIEDWHTLKLEAPKKVLTILEERGLQTDIAGATVEEAKNLCEELPKIINEFSYNEDGSVHNENRYVVGLLARILHAVHKRREYEEALAEAA